MTRAEFLDTLRRKLAGLPPADIDELVHDYATHFAEGLAKGRSEEEVADALGDPLRLAKELRTEAGLRRWERQRTPGSFFAVMFGFLTLVAVDFVVLLPVLLVLGFLVLLAGLAVLSLCLAGLVLMVTLGGASGGLFGEDALQRLFIGFSMLGFGVGGGALLILLLDLAVQMLGRFTRLHYTVLNRAETAP